MQIFFDTVPFEGKSILQTVRLLVRGAQPDRFQSPSIDDETWNLIEDCWKTRPSERPTMEQIVTRLTSFAQSRS